MTTQYSLDINRLIDKEQHQNFLELIKCKICFNILINPYDCSSCGNSFCYSCINTLAKNHQPCPFKCTSYTIKPSSYAITSYLSKLNFTCLNKDNGCNEIIPYNNILAHDKECKFFYTKCPNIQCGTKMKWTLLENHIKNECPFSLFKCPYCDIKLKRNEYKEHIINCKNVQMSMPLPNNEDPIKEKDKEEKFQNLIDSLPELREVSLSTFLKVILNQISLNNLYLDKKFESLKNEMVDIKESMDQISKSNIIFFENINNEFELLNNKIDKLDISIKDKEDIHNNISDVIRTVNEQKEINNLSTIPKISQFSKSNNTSSKSEEHSTKIKRRKKKSHTLKKEKIEIPNLKQSRQKCYSPRLCPDNCFVNEIENEINPIKTSNIYSSNINAYYQPPIAKPFNTFSNFTHSNLVSIIHNQEVILDKISFIEKTINYEHNKNNESIKTEIEISNQLSKLK